ncbi:LysR family transcriptional regulator [Chromobacterium vaccinii]|uniref:LysR family transcriptional regulator n=1 Tax=Chromobacterium vaccinii TaxID=1108595 RepID=UPI0031E0E83C
MMSVLELRHLKSLLALAETGSVSQAAQRVFLTQSALSHQLKQLEAAYGLTLFERKTQPLRFTPAGERLLRLARDLLAQVAAAERDLARIRQGEAGEVRVAVECHTCFDWLMPAMDQFRRNWPAVELDIVSGFHADPVGLLLSDRADLAIVSEAEPQAGVVHLPLFSYEMVGIAAREHPLAAKTAWRAEDFAAETLIHYPVADEMLDLLRKLLLPAGVNPARRTAELTIAIIQLVASRRGVAVLPYWAVQPYLERGYVVARQVGEEKLRSELYAALREDDADRAYMQDFVQTVRDSSFATLPGLSRLEA